MNIAYLILVHNSPKHFKRLIASLQSPNVSFFVHVDNKSDLTLFERTPDNNIVFLKRRISVYWGDYSQVQAILMLLREALNCSIEFERFVLISGADYPLRSGTYIERFFCENRTKEFINRVSMLSGMAGKPISRLKQFVIRRGVPGSDLFRPIVRRLVRRDYRTYLRNKIPYGGSTWWALTRDACIYILEFVSKESAFVHFFQNVACPDESFFQTIVGNSPFQSEITRNLTFTDWSEGGKSPSFISEKHLSILTSRAPLVINDYYGSGEVLFARKFDDSSAHLLNAIFSARLLGSE